MRTESLEFLKDLLSTPSPSGFERYGQRVWLDYVSQYADEVFTDVYGSAVGVLNPGAETSIMLVGHADEIGLMINYIDDNGFLYAKSIGGIDTAIVPGKRLTIHTKKGPVDGITGATAVHLRDRSGDGYKVREMHELFIDIGADSKASALRRVQIGDPVTFKDDFELIGKDLAVARALDNRIGTWAVAEALRLIKASGKKLNCTVYATSCVQEEIGHRGAHMLTMRLDPEMALVVDVGHATDTPGIDQRKHGEFKLGGGPIMSIGGPTLPEMNDRIEKVAKQARITLQREAEPGRSGTDTDHVFKVSGGVACGLVCLPIRYMHTPVEMGDLRDLEKIARLFSAFCLSLKKGEHIMADV